MKFLVIGDSCNDVFIYGKCERICPEAPVPVFIKTKRKKTGGMALNVFENIKSLGVDVDLITNPEKIIKTRYVDEMSNQLIIRVDSDKKQLNRICNINKINFSKYDAVVVSDYDKGFLTYKDIEYICKNHDYVFIDSKKIINESFKQCRFLKINEIEYNFNLKYSDFLLANLKKQLIVTLSSKGCRYLDKVFNVEKVEIKDMSGAGDTFLSALVYKYVLTNNINESIRFANECATIVVQQKGVNKIGDFLKVDQ